MALKHLEDKNFETAFPKTGKAVIDFYADWCGPCKMIAPVFEELSKEFEGKVEFFKVNIDKATATAEKFGVMSIPTLIYFKDGKNVDQSVGFVAKDALKKKIESI